MVMSAMRCSSSDASTTVTMAAAHRLPSRRAQPAPITPRGMARSTPALAQMSRYYGRVVCSVVIGVRIG